MKAPGELFHLQLIFTPQLNISVFHASLLLNNWIIFLKFIYLHLSPIYIIILFLSAHSFQLSESLWFPCSHQVFVSHQLGIISIFANMSLINFMGELVIYPIDYLNNNPKFTQAKIKSLTDFYHSKLALMCQSCSGARLLSGGVSALPALKTEHTSPIPMCLF